MTQMGRSIEKKQGQTLRRKGENVGSVKLAVAMTHRELKFAKLNSGRIR